VVKKRGTGLLDKLQSFEKEETSNKKLLRQALNASSVAIKKLLEESLAGISKVAGELSQMLIALLCVSKLAINVLREIPQLPCSAGMQE